MKKFRVNFGFKGDRSYVQGPDIFNTLSKFHSNNAKNIIFVAHGFITVPECELFLSTNKAEIEAITNLKARYSFIEHEQSYIGLKQAEESRLDIKRSEYDERQLVNLVTFQGQSISLQLPTPFTFVETLVSMNKLMHQMLFPQSPGKWVFTRMDLKEFCEASTNIRLTLLHNMNLKLTKTKIEVNDQELGYVYFSLVNK